jgi:hypothetical protein
MVNRHLATGWFGGHLLFGVVLQQSRAARGDNGVPL